MRRKIGLFFLVPTIAWAAPRPAPFHIEEATIADIQGAILSGKLTATALVKLYLARIKAYNGPGVEEPEGPLGHVVVVPHAKGINALCTLNLRPAARRAWGFDEHHARSLTDKADDDSRMPDALETAAHLDAEFARTGRLVGPLHGVVIAIKDQYDTVDMRTTAGGDADYANDRPPRDATFVRRLREAGAIIIAKANMSEYAGRPPRSSFGGTFVNAYDTTRTPNSSSCGCGPAVAANLVTACIGEESSASIRGPAEAASCVGLAGSEGLVSRAGMFSMGLHTRVGPVTRTVEDAARILTVMAGYDANDPMTAFSVGRLPGRPYEAFTHGASLKGMRIGVVREYMDRNLFTKADEQTFDLVDRAIDDLRRLGVTIVDPGPHGELFTKYIRALAPELQNRIYARMHPAEFPVDAAGKPETDQVETFVKLAANPDSAPGHFTLRDLGGPEFGGSPIGPGERTGPLGSPAMAAGESRFFIELYLKQRGDADIRSEHDLYTKARFYHDSPRFPNRQSSVAGGGKIFDTAARLQRWYATQEIILQAFADLRLDAVVYPTANTPPIRLGSPPEPAINGQPVVWTFLGQQGFPAITVPAGFTTEVYNRERTPGLPPLVAANDSDDAVDREPTVLTGPFPAVLPVGVDFLARPFDEATLFKIAAAFEGATHYRHPPPDFGPLPGEP